MLALLGGCQRHPECACPDGVEGHATYEGDACLCLPSLPPVDEPTPVTIFYVDPDVAAGGDGSDARPWTAIDWDAVDGALQAGPVLVQLSALAQDGLEAQEFPARLDVLRLDAGPHRLVLDGRARFNADDAAPRWEDAGSARARVPGVHTGFENIARSRITVRGLEVTGSDDKGVYWRAGDEVIIEDCEIHKNHGSPALNLEYVSRSGLPSSSFTVRNTHVYDQVGECIYIGGAEGEDLDAHALVVLENNLIHDCTDPFDTKHDGINIKDRIGEARVTRNVILRTDWGVEAASPGTYAHNVVIDPDREAFLINLSFGPARDLWFLDNAAIRPGHDGWHVDTEAASATGVRLERFTSLDAGEAGVLLGVGQALEIIIDDVVLAGGEVGLDGWGEPGALTLELGACALADNETDADRLLADRASCGRAELGARTTAAGPDGLMFTDDDGWIAAAGGARPPAAP